MDKRTYDESLEGFGEKLRKARKDVGMTQDQLSELSGVSQSMIAQYESGHIEIEWEPQGNTRRLI